MGVLMLMQLVVGGVAVAVRAVGCRRSHDHFLRMSLPPAIVLSSAAGASPGGRLLRCREIGASIVLARVFPLRLLDPGGESLLAYHAHRDRHVGVVLAAQFRALAVVDAFARRAEPGLVQAARNGVDLDAE